MGDFDFSSALDAVSSGFDTYDEDTTPPNSSPPQPSGQATGAPAVAVITSSKNYTPYIIGGVAIVAVIGLIFVMKK